MRLSLICPTIGRESLIKTIQSALPQMAEGDELIIVGDGPQPFARQICEQLPMIRYAELEQPVGDYGCTPCDEGIEMAQGDMVFFIGDDDQCDPEAFQAIRTFCSEVPDVPHAFGRKHGAHTFFPMMACSNISGQQIVVPLDRTKMPKMADCSKEEWPLSDWVFIDKVHKAWDGRTLLHGNVIAILRA